MGLWRDDLAHDEYWLLALILLLNAFLSGSQMRLSFEASRKRMMTLAAVVLIAVTGAAPVAPSPTVDQIVAGYVAARGGLKKIQSIQSLRQKGHATAGADRHALVTRMLKRPHWIRFEFTVQGVTSVYVSDGEKGWQVSPFEADMSPKPLSDEVVKEAAEQADIEGPLVGWKEKGHQVELAGREAVGGQEAYKLKSGAVRYEYIDVKSLNLVRTDSTPQVRGVAVQMETTFADYKKTSGIRFPRLITIAAAGRPQPLRIVVDTIEVNPPLSEALFEMSIPVQP
jgi:outer membrane lipoprotein-sorting protein